MTLYDKQGGQLYLNERERFLESASEEHEKVACFVMCCIIPDAEYPKR
jgi:hypothetical protein